MSLPIEFSSTSQSIDERSESRLRKRRSKYRSRRSPLKRYLGVPDSTSSLNSIDNRTKYRGVPDSTLVPKNDLTGLTFKDVAVKQLRPKDRFYFEVDCHNCDDRKRSELLERLIQAVRSDFDEYEVDRTRDGFHVNAKIAPSERLWKGLFKKYKRLFPESDFVDTGERLGLRISPKVSTETGLVESPTPEIILDTFRKSTKQYRKAPKSAVYLTNI